MSGRHRRAEAIGQTDELRFILFRGELRNHVADWLAEPGCETGLKDAWRLLPLDVLADVAEQACRDYAGYTLPRDEKRNFVIRYRFADRDRLGREAVLSALCAGEIAAKGFAWDAAPNAKRVRIAAERWSALNIDWEKDCADLMTGIVVRRARPTAGTTSVHHAQIGDQPLHAWVQRQIGEIKDAGGTCNREKIGEMATAEFGDKLSRDRVRKAYARAAPAEWTRAGRRKN
jgi:hypothetical protein